MAKAKILVVEDETIVAKAIQLSLKSYGYDAAATVSSGAEAIQKTAEMKPDLVLMDIVLKGSTDGITAAGQIRDRFDIPVVYLTAYTNGETIRRAKITEPFGYITKPFDEKELFTNIEMALYKHKMDKALRQSAQQWQATFDGITDAVCLLDNDAKILQCNQIMGALAGKKPEEVVGQNCCQIVHGSPIPLDGCPFVRMRSSLKSEEVELSVDGQWLRVVVDPLKDDDGKLTGAVHIISDITERKRAEAALQRSEAKYRDIVELAPDGIVTADTRGIVTSCNSALLKQTGYRKEDFIGKHFSKIPSARAKDIPKYLKMFAAVLLGKIPKPFEFMWIHKDGTEHWGDIRVSIMKRDGKAVGFQAIIRDITERKQAEETLKKSEERYKALFKGAPDGIIVADAETGQYIHANPSICKILGYSEEEIKGLSQFRGIHPKGETGKIKRLFFMQARGEIDIAEDIPFVKKDGTIRYFDVNSVSVEIDGIQRVIGLLRDITERKRAERQLERQTAVIKAINKVLREALTCETDADVARTCLSVTEELTGSKFGFIGELNKAGRFDCIAISDPGWDACTMPKTKAVRVLKDMEVRGIRGKVMQRGESLIFNAPSSDSSWIKPPKGHPKITSFLGVPLKHNGKVFGMIALANKKSGYNLADQQDIEALSVAFIEALMRKRAEGALRESEEKYSTLVEQAKDGIVIVQDKGDIKFANKALLNLLGYSEKEMHNKHFLDLVAPESKKEAVETYTKRMKGEQAPDLTSELKLLCKDGSKKDIEASSEVIRYQGKPANLSIVRDITDRKEAEALAKFPLENPHPVLRIGKDGIVQYSNPAGAELLRELGCEVGSSTPKHWNQYIRRALKSGSNEDLEVSCGEGIYSLIIAPVADTDYVNLYGIRIARGDGAEEDMQQYHQHLEDLVQIRTAELSKANEQLLAAIEVRRRLEKEILSISEQEQRRIGEEIHDSLGQHLTGIAFMTKVLERKLARKSLKEAAGVGKIVKLVEQATVQARSLVKGLGPVDLRSDSLVSSLEELAKKTSDLFGVRCVFGCDKVCVVDNAAAAVHIYRIAQEAINNAVKHGRAKNVEIVLACGEDECALTVKNDGLDFPKEFEAEGAGMGLKIMEHRIDLIGGVLDIRAADEGGTILTCTFPGRKNRD